MLIGNINRTERKKQKRSGKQKGHLPTAVTRNGEKCGKFTFIFRKKFYLSRKYAVPKFATSCSREPLCPMLQTTVLTSKEGQKTSEITKPKRIKL